MATLASYADLQDAIAAWLGQTNFASARSDVQANIPIFIKLAEAKLNRNLFCPQMEGRSTTTLDTTLTNPEFIALPSDFKSLTWIRLSSVTGKPHLEYKAPVAIEEMRASEADGADQPRYYTIISSNIELCPRPDFNYTVEIAYRKLLPTLSATNATNWLLTLAPDAYLYGSLMEASAYGVDDARVPLWAQAYKIVVDDLNNMTGIADTAGPVAISASLPTP